MPFNDNFICRHMQLSREDIVDVIRRKQLVSFQQIQDETDAATVCGSCVGAIDAILEEELRLRAEQNKKLGKQ